MTAALLLLALAGAPKGPAEAELVTWVPRLDAMSSLLPFFRAAGTRSLSLRPEAWRQQAEPLLELDITSRDSLDLAGVDSSGGLTTSSLGERTFTCLTLTDPKRFTARATERLARMGDVFTKTEGAVTVTASRDPINRVLGAIAVSGKDACTLVGHGLSVEKQLPLLRQSVVGKLTSPAVALIPPGVASFLVPSGSKFGAVSLTAKGLTLTGELKARNLPVAELSGPGPSPYATFTPVGILSVRARFARTAMPRVLDQLVARLPVDLSAPARALAPALSGQTALLVERVSVTTGLRTPAARFFAVRFAIVAEVSDLALATSVVSAVDTHPLTLREGTLELGLVGNHVVLSNDPDTRRRAVASLDGSAGKQAHAVEFSVSPQLTATALAQVPLLEAIQAPELAGIVALSSELGPLLVATERMDGFVEAPGPNQTRAQATWALNPSRFAMDAGTP